MNGSLFAQLQAVNSLSADTTVLHLRKQLNDFVAWFKQRDDYMDVVTTMAKHVRNLEVQTLLNCDSFMIQDDFYLPELPDEFKHDSLGICHGDSLLFRGRYIYPVKDVRGDVMGLCGYDKFDDMKYRDSKNYGYVAKTYSCWGMEELSNYYRSTRPVFFVEGIVCALYLRQSGLQALAFLGSQVSSYMIEVMRRFAGRCIVICDADEAGTICRNILRRKLPTVRCVQSTVAKDVDDSREVDAGFIEDVKLLEKTPYVWSKYFK